MAYKVKGSTTDEEIVIATTRIETMLGDTGLWSTSEKPRTLLMMIVVARSCGGASE
jgi:valyl-tRNA synthetase